MLFLFPIIPSQISLGGLERDLNLEQIAPLHASPGVPSSTTPAPFLLIIIPQLIVPWLLHFLITFILYNKSKMKETIPPRIRLVNVTSKIWLCDAEIRASYDNVDLTVKK